MGELELLYTGWIRCVWVKGEKGRGNGASSGERGVCRVYVLCSLMGGMENRGRSGEAEVGLW